MKGMRIAFKGQFFPARSNDFVFIGHAFADIGDEDFPDAATRMFPHDVAATVPEIEIADDANPPRVGCPDGKAHPVVPLVMGKVGAKLLPALKMIAFSQQMQVYLAESAAKGVRIDDGFAVITPRGVKYVVEPFGALGFRFKHAAPDEFCPLWRHACLFWHQ